MVFKRYIHRNGKKFGPYYYESYRDEKGNTHTKYLENYKEPRAVTSENNLFKKHSMLFILLGAIIIIFLSISFLSYQFSEKQQKTGNSFFENVGSKVYSFFTGFTTEGSTPDTTTPTTPSETSSGTSDTGSGSTPTEATTTSEASPTETTTAEAPPTETTASETTTSEQTNNETSSSSISENTTQTPEANNTDVIPTIESNNSATNQTTEFNETNTTAPENITIENPNGGTSGAGISNVTNGTTIGNESLNNFSIANVTGTNITNETIVNETIKNATSNVTLETSVKQYGAVLGKPVKWEKKVKVFVEGNDSVSNLRVDLPDAAGNVSVKKISDAGEEKVDVIVNNEKTIQEVSPNGEKTSQGNFFTTAFNFILGIIRFTGNVVNEGDTQNVSVEISSSVQNQDELIVEYYTGAPYAQETNVTNVSKQISIIGPEGVDYKNVLAFTELENETIKSKIRLYSITDGNQTEVNLSFIDSNNNNLIDRVEWVVPNLGYLQTYLLKTGGREIRLIVKLKDKKTKVDIGNFGESEKTIKTEKNNLEVISVNEDNVASLKNDPNIESVMEDQPVSLLLNDSEQIIRSTEVKNNFSLNGSGEKVCVIDTGVDYNNSDITNYIAGFDFANNDSDPMDDNGHGTSVAGVVSRIAPGSELYIAKVIYANGTGYESTVLQGLQWCIDQNVNVISFSIGAGSYDGFCDADLVAELANNAVSKRMFVVAATGNDGNLSLKTPACASNVTRVGSTTKQDEIAVFSSGGEKVDVFAPGVSINVPVLGGGSALKSGTSISAPMVAAGASIVLQNESLSPSDLKYRLRSTGTPIFYDLNSSTQINISRLDIYNAVINNKTMEPYNYFANQSNVTQNQTFQLLDTAIHYYNFSDTTNNKAYNGSDGSNPPTDPWVSGPTVLNSTNLFNLNISDDKYHSTSGSDAGVNWYNIHKAVFKITESVSSINSINFTWEGYNTKGFELASQNDLYLYVYNFTSGSWGSSRNISCENNACGTVGTQKNLTFQISSGISDIINGTGHLLFLVEEFEMSGISYKSNAPPEIEYLNDTANSRGINNLTPTTRKYYTVFTDRMEVQVNYTNSSTNNPPTQSTPIIVPTTAYNVDNITCVNQSTTDADGDAVTNVYNWLVNTTGTSVSTTLLYYPFDINSANTSNNAIRDYSGFGNNGTLGGGNSANASTWNSSGKIGGAYTFNGVGNFINISKSGTLNATYNFSVDVWVRPNITSGTYYIFDNYPGGAVGDGNFLLYINSNTINSFNELAANVVSDTIVANQWYHVAVVMTSGSNYKLYINGALNKTDSSVGSGPFLDSGGNFSIGDMTNGANPFSGDIDNLRVWNRSLSPEQVNQLYLEGANNYTNSSIIYTELNSGENWTCQVIPNDAQNDGALAINSTIILPNAPTQSTPIIVPTSVYNADNMTCVNQSTVDVGGRAVTNVYNWLVNVTNATSLSATLLYLPFDTNTSNVSNNGIKDYSGFENHGTLGGGNGSSSAPVWNSSGKIGGAYTFDGINDTINVTKSGTLNNTFNFSVDVWIRPDITSGTYYIFDNYAGGSVVNGNFLLYVNGNTINSFNEASNNVVSSTISANQWYHVAAVMTSGSNYKLYINGALNATDSVVTSGPFLDLNNNFSIGMMTDAENPFVGNIDNLRVWNRSLSPEQVNQLYLEGANNYTNSSIIYTETNAGENWTCQVTPNNARADGTLAINSTIILTSRPPTVSVVSPSNNSRVLNGITFNCNATDDIGLQNISLYGNWSGSWAINQTNNVSGTSNNTNFSVALPEGTFLWSCSAYDNDSNSAWASNNFTVYNDACASTNISTSTIQSNDTCDWYNFTASNIYLDCNGYKISRYNNVEDWAVLAQNLTNVTVKNCYFTNWTHGISYYNTTNSNISNTTFYNLTDRTTGDVNAIAISIGNYSNNSLIDGVNITLVFANSTSVTSCYNNSYSRAIWIANSNFTKINSTIISNVTGESQGFFDSFDGCLVNNRISLGEEIQMDFSHNSTIVNTSLNTGYYGINSTSSNYTNITQSNFSFFNFPSAGISAYFKSSYLNYITYSIFNNSNNNIQFASSPYANVTNNQIYNATGNNLIFSTSSNYPTVGYNIIGSGSGFAVQFSSITGGKIENNTVQHLAATASGAVRLASTTNLQSFKNNTLFNITGSGSFAVYSAATITAIGNNFTNVTQGYSFVSGSGNSQVFNDSITNAQNATVIATGATNISFYNVTYNQSAAFVQGTGTFYNYYYLKANITDQSSNGLNSASVNITNSTGSGSPENTITTDANGLTAWTLIQTFNKSSSLLTNHTPHNVTAFKTGYSVNYTNVDMYQSRFIQLTISTPFIQAYVPSTDVFSIAEPNNQTFSIVISNTTPVYIKWFVNGTQQTNYDNNTQFVWVGNFSQEGFYSIKVNVSNSFGEDQHTWNMTVNNTPASVMINNTYPILSLNASQNKFFNVTLNVTCLSTGDNCGTVNVTLYANDSLANITAGATPFYTNASTNPLTTVSLNAGQSATITFWLNATGNINTTSSFFAYANLTSNLSVNNKTSNWNVTITDPFTLAIDLSSLLGSQINWTITTIPAVNQSADGNNGSGVTGYWVNVSVTNGNADVYIRASGNLTTSGGSILELGNETYSYNSTNSSVPNDTRYQLTTNFSNNKIGTALSGNSLIYLKFFLSVPTGQPAGIYNNTVEVRGVEAGQTP